LALDVALGWGVNASTTFGGTALLKIWQGEKTFKNRCDLRQLSSLSANISGTEVVLQKTKVFFKKPNSLAMGFCFSGF